jgi:hypothetical protein
MKLALAQFIIAGPPDAVMDPARGSIMSQFTGIRLQVCPASGKMTSAMWVDRHGRLHNPHGPAHMLLWHSGTVRALRWCLAGRLHRPLAAGPAIIRYDEAGDVGSQEFAENPFV